MLREVLRRGTGRADGDQPGQVGDDQPGQAAGDGPAAGDSHAVGDAPAAGDGQAAGNGQAAGRGQQGQAQAGWVRRLPAAVAALVGRHRLFSVALVLGVVPRVVAMLGYQPAILFRLDTYDYLWGAVHLRPNPVNPSGYSLVLWVLRPFHSLALIAGIQQLAGLGIAVAVYVVLRHWGVRSWIATLAAAPVLFSPAQLLLEQLVMADIMALLLMVVGFAVLLTRDAPSARRVATAGLLMGASVLVRPTALPLIPAMAVYLLVRRASWRKVGAVLAGAAVPVVVYLAWFASAYGSFNLTNSNGLFLWTRTMSFANCAVIKPPADLQALCPNRQPGYLNQPVAKRPLPKRYLWDHLAWQWQPPTSGLVPDTAAFTKANNDRALHFAIRAITAQPVAYLHVVTSDTLHAFGSDRQLLFPATPASFGLGNANGAYALAAVRAYTGSTSGIGAHLGYHYGYQLRQPFARMMNDYQRLIVFPGPLFALILVVGLAGIIIPRRRTAAAGLLWFSAAISIVLPIAEHEYTYRYVVPAVPLACMAVALIFASRRAPAVAGPAAPDPDQDTSEARSPENADTAPAAS
jgi:Glycosyltransferase family 87